MPAKSDKTPETKDKKFSDNAVRTVYRHWLCPNDGCDGEMIGTGKGFTTFKAAWENVCTVCGYKEWASCSYPVMLHLEE